MTSLANDDVDAAYIFAHVRIDSAGCWRWTGRINQQTGYAQFSYKGRTTYGHRLSHETFIGPIPEGLTIDHLCRVHDCANPRHLEAVTVDVNIKRSPVQVTTLNAAKTHCYKGHEFTPENTMRVGRGRGRRCRECSRTYQRTYLPAYRARKKAGNP